MAGRAQLEGILGQLDELWGHLDTLFDTIEAKGEWERGHGPDWTFADVAYHLAYFDAELIVRGLGLGPDYPEDQQERYATTDEINAWNARQFAKRPFGQPPQASVAQTRA